MNNSPIDDARQPPDTSTVMRKPWTPPYRWVFGAATALGLFSTLQAYRLTTISVKTPIDIEVGKLLALNVALWFIPAALTPFIFALTRRYRPDERFFRLIAVHATAALVLSCVHAAGMAGVRAALWGPPEMGWITAIQRQYLWHLDWALMTYTTIVGAIYSVGYYSESQARKLKEAQLETRLAEARLRTLEAELQPHFLFNTLHAISTLVHVNPDSADRMISRLSDLLRLTFDRSGAPKVALQEELEFLQKYLEIEQIRFQDRLTVRYDIDPETLDAEVPRLILQPLVENAIKHGVSPRSGLGTVEITSKVTGEDLWLEVRDHGAGPADRSRMPSRVGVGLANTRDRLECLYGEAHTLEVADGDNGFAVRIRLPLQRLPVPHAVPAATLVA
jgi:two-component system, LytTR family, sensor kinase